MKIVQLVYHLGSGGAEKIVVDLSNALASMGHEVTVIMLRDSSVPKFGFNCRFLSGNVKLVSLCIPEGFRFAYIKQIEEVVLKEKPDVVHAHLNILPYIFRLSIRRRDIRFVHTIHNMAKFENQSRIVRFFCRFFYRRNIIVPVTISKQCDVSFRDTYKLNNAVLIPNGRSFPSRTEEFETVKKELSSRPGPVFVHVARCSKEKNQKVLVDAFNEILTPFSLYIIGSGFESANDLKSMASPNIHFIGQKANVADYLLCADAFCLTSLLEGLPISLLEAMACGLTPICTPAGGIPDVIEDGKTGYISEDFTKEEYIKAIRRFLEKPLEKENIVAAYKDKYSLEKCAEKYVQVYSRS